MALVLDPLAPPPSARDVWERLDALAGAVVVLKPDHIRDVDLFVRWYRAEAHGPYLFWAGDGRRRGWSRCRPGQELPGGLTAHLEAAARWRRPSTSRSSARSCSPTG